MGILALSPFAKTSVHVIDIVLSLRENPCQELESNIYSYRYTTRLVVKIDKKIVSSDNKPGYTIGLIEYSSTPVAAEGPKQAAIRWRDIQDSRQPIQLRDGDCHRMDPLDGNWIQVLNRQR
jgi:hypothetical protein